MENSQRHINRVRKKRAMRVRKRVKGSQARPRMSVVKSNKHVQVQIINDEQSVTIASVSTLSKEFRGTENGKKSIGAARQLGAKIAELAKEKNVKQVIFDRGPFKYHGVVAAVADAAREGGLEF